MYALKSFVIAFLCFAFFAPALAQEFKDGFIVDRNKNYVYGFIAVTSTPHLTCLFKEQKDGTPVTYATGQIEAYGIINGNHFRKRPVENFEGNFAATEIFLEAVADGPIAFYVAFDRMFIERGSSFYEIKDDKNKEMLNSYRATIASLVGDCGNMAKRAKTIAITIPSLKLLVESYNQCAGESGQSTTSSRAFRKSSHTIGVVTGLDRTQLSLAGTTNAALDNKAFTDRTLMSGGLTYTFGPKWSQRFSLATGLWFNDQRLYLSGKANANGYSRVQTARINYRVLRLPVLLEVGNFLSSKAQPYIKGGISLPFMLKQNITVDEEDERNDVVYINQYAGGDDFKEPLFLHLSGGVNFPLKERLFVFCEVYYSKGNNTFKLETPKTVTGNFNSKGFNVGLVIRSF